MKKGLLLTALVLGLLYAVAFNSMTVIVPANTTAAEGANATFSFSILNDGDEEDTISVSVQNLSDGIYAWLKSTSMTVAAGEYVNFTLTLQASIPGSYSTEVNISSTNESLYNLVNVSLTVNDTHAPGWSLNRTADLGTYTADAKQFNITWTDAVGIDTVQFEVDSEGNLSAENDGEEFHIMRTVSAGEHSWSMHANDTSGNVNSTDVFYFTTQRANSSIVLEINGTASNHSSNESTFINITAYVFAGEGTASLYADGELIGNSTAAENMSTYLPGLHNITAAYHQSENYSRAELELWLWIDDSTAPALQLVGVEEEAYYNHSSRFLDVTTDDLCNCSYTLDNLGQATLSIVPSTSHTATLSMPDAIHNLTVNCSNQGGLSSGLFVNFTVDTTDPIVSIAFPSPYANVSGDHVNFSYTAEDINIDSAWYYLDFNTTYAVDLSQENHTVTLQHPGKHIITVNADDLAGNRGTISRIFYSEAPLDASRWYAEVENELGAVANLTSASGSIDGLVDLSDDFRLSMNLTDAVVEAWNLTANQTMWSFIFNASMNDANLRQSFVENTGSNGTDLVFVGNFSTFFSGTYLGAVRLPHNRSGYDHVYYCGSDMASCQKVQECGSTPCYIDSSENLMVYVPHFSAVVGSNDTAGPAITSLNPVDGAVLLDASNHNLTIQTNEAANCTFSLDGAASGNMTYLGSNQWRKIFSLDTDIWADGAHELVTTCNDSSGNIAIEEIGFTVNDTTAPNITMAFTSVTEDDARLNAIASEPAHCRYFTSNVAFESMTDIINDTLRRTNYRTVSTEGTYYVRCRDDAGNEGLKSSSVNFDDEEEDDGGGSGGSGSSVSSERSKATAPKKVTLVFQRLSAGSQIFYISSADLALTQISFELLKDKNSTVTTYVEKLDTMPDLGGLSGVSYQFFRVSSASLPGEDIKDVRLRFRIPITWFVNQDTERLSVVLHRYDDGWTPLRTDLADTDSSYIYYEAMAEDLGYFAVTSSRKEAAEAAIISPGDQPPPVTGGVVQDEEGATVAPPDQKTITERTLAEPFLVIIPLVFIFLIGSLAVFLIYQHKFSILSDSELKEIKEYVEKCEIEGISLKKIRESLVAAGWEHRIVDLVLHDVHLPHQDLEKIIKYIKHCQEHGQTKSEITANLKRAGWQPEVIENAYSEMK